MINKKLIPYILSMMLIVLASNYLVQFPFNFLNLNDVLTWGAFTYPVAFLVTDLANRLYGINFTKRVIHVGFVWAEIWARFQSSTLPRSTVLRGAHNRVSEDLRIIQNGVPRDARMEVGKISSRSSS